MTENPTELTHSIVIPMADSDDPYVIPLSLKSVSSSFPTRKPTLEEYNTVPHLTLTSNEPEYDPHDRTFAEQDEALTKYVSETGDSSIELNLEKFGYGGSVITFAGDFWLGGDFSKE